jgi:Domain of unknown function (DUF4389)
MSGGRIALIVFGCLVGLLGLALVVGGAALLWANQALRDDDGYFTSDTERFQTPLRAISSENLDLGDVPGGSDRWADLRIRAERPGGAPVFVGIGPRVEVEQYLAGVPHAVITDLDLDPFRATYEPRLGRRLPLPPATQDFWAARATGPGEQTLTWDVEDGDWQIVAMNADGSAPVVLDASLGVKISFVLGVAIGILVVGVLLLGGGIAMAVLGGRGPRGPPPDAAPAGVAGVAEDGPPAAPPAGAPGPGEQPPTYPVDVTGELDPGLSRWLWLVKWLLAIPHYIVLFFLWIAYFAVTFVAFFAILFTGRYPRTLFEFNAGVLRWSWCVGFYAYGALGTDRYPPFTLERTDYPARIEVPYPEHLSRGLVLVKWWLLAIPQYIVVAILAGSWAWGWGWDGEWGWTDGWWSFGWTPAGGGLIGILVLFAGIALLFTGRYPRGLFGLVVALNRYVYRVVAYATLMRDEYPPFSLDR